LGRPGVPAPAVMFLRMGQRPIEEARPHKREEAIPHKKNAPANF
jgi:hypothetical protein